MSDLQGYFISSYQYFIDMNIDNMLYESKQEKNKKYESPQTDMYRYNMETILCCDLCRPSTYR